MRSLLPKTKSLHIPAAYGEPPIGWEWSRLDDICDGVFDCPHSTPQLTGSGPFVVRTQDIITGIFRQEQAAQVSEETYADRITRARPRRGDLLYSREGTYFGIAAEIPENVRVCLGQRMVLIRPSEIRANAGYLRYWLNSPIMANHIRGYRDGTVAERLNLPTIRALPVVVPPLPEQKAIAAVLGSLDDKIELNRRMNATLEAMARALFQSWFVDFDPVRAKLDGGAPIGLDEATAALFPDSLVESDLGKIPKGWRYSSVQQTTAGLYDGPHATPPKSETGPIFLGISNFKSSSLDFSSVRHIAEENFAKWTKRVVPRRLLKKSQQKSQIQCPARHGLDPLCRIKFDDQTSNISAA